MSLNMRIRSLEELPRERGERKELANAKMYFAPPSLAVRSLGPFILKSV